MTWAGGFALAIPAGINGDREAAAWEFLKDYCYGKEAQVLFGSRTGQMPALLEAAEAGVQGERPPHAGLRGGDQASKIRDVTPAGDEVWFNNATQERPFALFSLRDRVIEAKMSISDILDNPRPTSTAPSTRPGPRPAPDRSLPRPRYARAWRALHAPGRVPGLNSRPA